MDSRLLSSTDYEDLYIYYRPSAEKDICCLVGRPGPQRVTTSSIITHASENE